MHHTVHGRAIEPACRQAGNRTIENRKTKARLRSNALLFYYSRGQLAQLVRALRSHRRGHRFKSCIAHYKVNNEPKR